MTVGPQLGSCFFFTLNHYFRDGVFRQHRPGPPGPCLQLPLWLVLLRKRFWCVRGGLRAWGSLGRRCFPGRLGACARSRAAAHRAPGHAEGELARLQMGAWAPCPRPGPASGSSLRALPRPALGLLSSAAAVSRRNRVPLVGHRLVQSLLVAADPGWYGHGTCRAGFVSRGLGAGPGSVCDLVLCELELFPGETSGLPSEGGRSSCCGWRRRRGPVCSLRSLRHLPEPQAPGARGSLLLRDILLPRVSFPDVFLLAVRRAHRAHRRW